MNCRTLPSLFINLFLISSLLCQLRAADEPVDQSIDKAFEALQSKDKAVRTAAAERLSHYLYGRGQLAKDHGLALMDRFLDALPAEDDAKVRRDLVEMLDRLYHVSLDRAVGADRLERLKRATDKLLKDPDPKVRVCSASLLASVDPERKKDAVAVHMEALKDKDADLRISAASSLIGIDKSYKTEVVPFLIEILDKDLQPDRRAEAAMLLRECGPAAKAAVPALLRALNAKDDYTRVRVAEELLEIDPNQAGAVIPVLIELLDSADSGGEAASELSKLKLSAKDAKAALAKLLPAKNEKPSEFLPKLNRVQKLGALALLDPEDDDAIRLLVETLGDPDYVVVRSFVLRALGALGPRGKVAVPAILDVAKADESGSCTWQICQALAQIGPGAKEAIPWLNEHRKSKDGAIRKAAATALQIIDADKEKPENDLR